MKLKLAVTLPSRLSICQLFCRVQQEQEGRRGLDDHAFTTY